MNVGPVYFANDKSHINKKGLKFRLVLIRMFVFCRGDSRIAR